MSSISTSSQSNSLKFQSYTCIKPIKHTNRIPVDFKKLSSKKRLANSHFFCSTDHLKIRQSPLCSFNHLFIDDEVIHSLLVLLQVPLHRILWSDDDVMSKDLLWKNNQEEKSRGNRPIAYFIVRFTIVLVQVAGDFSTWIQKKTQRTNFNYGWWITRESFIQDEKWSAMK